MKIYLKLLWYNLATRYSIILTTLNTWLFLNKESIIGFLPNIWTEQSEFYIRLNACFAFAIIVPAMVFVCTTAGISSYYYYMQLKKAYNSGSLMQIKFCTINAKFYCDKVAVKVFYKDNPHYLNPS